MSAPTGLSHIGIAVHAIDDALPVYLDVLGGRLVERRVLEDRGLEVAFVKVGDVEVELLQAIRPGTAIEKFLATRGPGIHHIAFEVDDVSASLDRMRDAGVRLIDETPKPGAHGEVAFLHPSSLHGVLVEFCGRPRTK